MTHVVNMSPKPEPVLFNHYDIPVARVSSHAGNSHVEPLDDRPFREALMSALDHRFDALRRHDPVFGRFVDRLQERAAKAVVFGGWVRDQIVAMQHARSIGSRDIDMVVDGLAGDDLRAVVPEASRVNIFGGFSTQMHNVGLDIWRLEDTFLIRRLKLPVKFETLPRTTVFRINSVVFKPAALWGTPDLCEHGAAQAIKRRIIDFQAECLPFPGLQVARAVIYATKLHFDLSTEVTDFIRRICRTRGDLETVLTGLKLNCPVEFADPAADLLQEVLRAN